MVRIDVLWTDEDGTPRVAPAKIEDPSHGGFSIRMKYEIRVGSMVSIKFGSEQVSGTVTNCRAERSEYVVGIKRDSAAAADPI